MSQDPARITLTRRVDWVDTDAAQVAHWTTVFRLVEAAEAHLHHRLGIQGETFGRTPRVHVESSFRKELRFFDRAELRLQVDSVGRTSLRYAFHIHLEGDEDPAVEGALVVVYVTGQPQGRPTPWPPELRERLLEGGDQGEVAGA